MKAWINILFGLLLSFTAFSQEEDAPDSSAYDSYKNRVILYTHLGYNVAPFSIRYSFPQGVDKIKYRHNFKTVIGLGFSYKWFSVRFGAALVGNVRPVSRYGQSNYFDIDAHFSIRKTYSEIDYRIYTGYVLKDAYKWIDTLNELTPNDMRQKISAYNVAFKMWYLDNKDFRMDPFDGIKGSYRHGVTTWYMAGRLDFYGVGNQSGSLVSPELFDSTKTITAAGSLFGMDIGVIPGIGHVSKKKNWQYGAMLALGPCIQIKSYNLYGENNGLAGIVARYDVKLVGGYSVPRFFAMFCLEMNNKNINFDQFKYFQSFYGMRLSLGYRFREKEKHKKDS